MCVYVCVCTNKTRRTRPAQGVCDYTNIHPETYLLHEVNGCVNLFTIYLETVEEAIDAHTSIHTQTTTHTRNTRTPHIHETSVDQETYWFWKPPGGSFGRGIRVSGMYIHTHIHTHTHTHAHTSHTHHTHRTFCCLCFSLSLSQQTYTSLSRTNTHNTRTYISLLLQHTHTHTLYARMHTHTIHP